MTDCCEHGNDLQVSAVSFPNGTLLQGVKYCLLNACFIRTCGIGYERIISTAYNDSEIFEVRNVRPVYFWMHKVFRLVLCCTSPVIVIYVYILATEIVD